MASVLQSQIRRALKVAAPARADHLKPPRTLQQRILDSYLKMVEEDPETAMDDKEQEEGWLATQRARVEDEERENEERGTAMTSSESSHYSTPTEGSDFSTSSSSDSSADSFSSASDSSDLSSGRDSVISYDDER